MKIEKITVVAADAAVRVKKGVAAPAYNVRGWIVGVFADTGFVTGAELLAAVNGQGLATGDEKWGRVYARREYAVARAGELLEALGGPLAKFADAGKLKLSGKVSGELEEAKSKVAELDAAAAGRAAHAKTDAGKLERLRKCAAGIAKSRSTGRTLAQYAGAIEKKTGKYIEELAAAGLDSLDELLDKALAESKGASQKELAKAMAA